MDYREQLSRPLSKHYVDSLVLEVFDNPSDFDSVYQLIFDPNEKVRWRAAWACQKISEKYPQWFNDQHFFELANLALSTTQGGLHRGCLSIIRNISLPENIPVEFINACFDWMISPKYPIAVQALSMRIGYAICKRESDFIPEFIAYLENVDVECYSPGFKSTRKNVFKMLNYK
jgi:hypothetical protein